MRGLKLNDNDLIHNDGSDLWDYMFEGVKLPKTYSQVEEEDMDDWYEEGIEWLTDNLLDGEVFEIFEEDNAYAFTSFGRHAHLKRKNFKALTLQGNSIAGNMKAGAFSMSKRVKARWNIDLDYKTLPNEVSNLICTTNAAKHIKEWIEQNG